MRSAEFRKWPRSPHQPKVVSLLANIGCGQKMPSLGACPDRTAPPLGAGREAMIDLAVILWLASALPVAMLIGYCALGEEL